MPGPDLERLELRTASKQVPAVPPVPPLRFPPSPALQPAHTQSVGRAENSGDDGSETSDSLSCSSDGGGAEGRAEREEQADFASRLLEAEVRCKRAGGVVVGGWRFWRTVCLTSGRRVNGGATARSPPQALRLRARGAI